MIIFYIISEMQNEMAVRNHSIPRHCKKKINLLNIGKHEDNRNTYIPSKSMN